MRDLKTYLSVAPVVSTLWFGALAGLLIEINRFFPDALIFPFFSFQLLAREEVKKIRDPIKYLRLIPLFFFFSFFFRIRFEQKKNKGEFGLGETRNLVQASMELNYSFNSISILNRVRPEMEIEWLGWGQQYHTRYLNEN